MKKILTIVLDGYGYSENEIGNAVKKANTPTIDGLWEKYPHSLLEASEEAVGLPAGQAGGSEVGHSTLGAGRVLKQELIELNEMFENKAFDQNEDFQEMVKYATENNCAFHLIGLLSNGGVHAHIKHFKETIKILKKTEIKNFFIHIISDGRDTLNEEVMKYVNSIKKLIENDPRFKIASLCGRFYAMDRDNKWERTKIYYDLITRGTGYNAIDLSKAVESCYKKGLSDEFIPPIMLEPTGMVKDRDAVLWMNFRTDRAKQILMALTNQEFNTFLTKKMPGLKVYTFYEVDKLVKATTLIPPHEIVNPLGRYISNLGLTQARIAETEKFAHVTFFFDGLYKGSVEGCDRFLVPSPHVQSYDEAPRMSAMEVCKKTIAAMNKDYDFILVNFANPDMVGHSGNFDATVEAIEEVDRCLSLIKESAEMNFYTIFLLADHGNADQMFDENNNPITSHTTAKVPFIVCDEKVTLKDGSLANVAPAILKYMDIKIPEEMQKTEQIMEIDN